MKLGTLRDVPFRRNVWEEREERAGEREERLSASRHFPRRLGTAKGTACT